MTNLDKTQIRNLEVINSNLSFFQIPQKSRILLISPNLFDYLFWKKSFPKSQFIISNFKDWNIECSFSDSKLRKKIMKNNMISKGYCFDIAIAQNVFMYIEHPNQAITNILEISDKLFLQDLKYRKRSSNINGLGFDGDKSRYSFQMEDKLIHNHFTIDNKQNYYELIFKREFQGGINKYHTSEDSPIHILCMLQSKKRKIKLDNPLHFPKISLLQFLILGYLKSKKHIILDILKR